MIGDVLLLMWPQSPIDEHPAAFPERVVVLVEDRPLHRASIETPKLLISKFTRRVDSQPSTTIKRDHVEDHHCLP
jgi:hypothetical protein